MITAAERETEEQSVQQWAKLVNVTYLDSRQLAGIEQLASILTLDEVRQFGVVPLALTGQTLKIGFTEHTDRGQLEALKAKLAKYQLEFYAVSQSGFAAVVNRLDLASYQPDLEQGKFDVFEGKLRLAPPKQVFTTIAQLAYLLKASDIHIEPSAGTARLRFRIDGALHTITTVPIERYNVFLSDLQTRAQIKWGVDVPQAGRFSAELLNEQGETIVVDMRLETMPVLHGEEIVVRLFNLEARYLQLDNMGLSESQRALIDEVTTYPHGMVLSVGPTGSGKTSTLYALLKQLNDPEIKIITLEDPVEYELPGISQIPVHSEDNELFGQKLRAVLRQDPDIIMIGEIRDMDTAKTALQAALTGHLVVSTFHAANASAAVSRLMDMIGQNPLLASALRIIMAQRLVRRVCPDCKQAYTPDPKLSDEIRAILEPLPAKLRPQLANLKLYHGKGCKQCHHFGYRGRIGILEQLVMSPKLEALIAAGTADSTAQKIQAQAVADGMVTLVQDGLLKALAGLTTAEEVFRAADS